MTASHRASHDCSASASTTTVRPRPTSNEPTLGTRGPADSVEESVDVDIIAVRFGEDDAMRALEVVALELRAVSAVSSAVPLSRSSTRSRPRRSSVSSRLRRRASSIESTVAPCSSATSSVTPARCSGSTSTSTPTVCSSGPATMSRRSRSLMGFPAEIARRRSSSRAPGGSFARGGSSPADARTFPWRSSMTVVRPVSWWIAPRSRSAPRSRPQRGSAGHGSSDCAPTRRPSRPARRWSCGAPSPWPRHERAAGRWPGRCRSAAPTHGGGTAPTAGVRPGRRPRDSRSRLRCSATGTPIPRAGRRSTPRPRAAERDELHLELDEHLRVERGVVGGPPSTVGQVHALQPGLRERRHRRRGEMDDPLIIAALRHEHRDHQEPLEVGKLISRTDLGVGLGRGHAEEAQDLVARNSSGVR